MNYYYFMSALPRLSLGAELPVTSAEFRSQCRQYLTASDDALLDDVMEDRPSGQRHPFALEWHRLNNHLRNTLARLRGQRLGKEAAPWFRPAEGFEVYLADAVATAYARSDPLDREFELDRVRWKIADDLAGFNHFSIAAVLAYALQLKLAERWAGMQAERGQRTLEEAVSG